MEGGGVCGGGGIGEEEEEEGEEGRVDCRQVGNTKSETVGQLCPTKRKK